ncbi:MAG: hypothetical protein IJC18_06250, partial [Clostridia bacterium]|nr:hypothetical protein [Clostridia bacterium]
MQSSTIVNKSFRAADHADADFALSPTNLTSALLALLLHERGYRVTLHRPAAQQDDIVLLSQSGLICTELIRRFGIDTARALAAAHLAAMRQYRRLASLYDIEYSQCPIFVRSQDSSLLINETAAAARLGIPATFTGDAMRLDGQLCIKYAQMKAPVRKRITIHDAPPVTISTGDTGT